MTMKKKLAVMFLSATLVFGSFGTLSANAAVSPSTTLLNEMIAIHDATTTAERSKIDAARTTLLAVTDLEWGTILGSTVDPLNLSVGEKTELINLLHDASVLMYDSTGSNIEALRSNTGYHDLLQGIATRAGETDLTVDDFVGLALALQTAMFNKISSLSAQQLLDLVTDSSYRNTVAKDTVESVLGNNTYTISRVFKHYYSASDTSVLTAAVNGILSKPNVVEASLALYAAYQRVHGISGGGGGGGTVVTGDKLTDLTKTLDDLNKKLAGATGTELQKLVDEAVSAATKAVEALNSFNAETMKTITNGQVTINADGKALLSSIDDLAKAKADLKKILDSAKAGDQMPAMNLILDIGAISESAVAFKLPENVIKKAIEAGLDGVQLKLGDVTVTVPLGGEFSKAIEFNVTKKSGADAKLVTDLKVLSQVFDFGMTIDGKSVTQFNHPVTIRIPLTNLGSADKELLSVAKIVDGKLVFQGGRIVGNEIVEPRDTFSSYVVVENKVSFDDIANVQSWAGRQIQVVAAKGAVEGKAEGKFAPKDLITRAEFAKMLIRALNLENSLATSSFSDVNASDWFAPYVAAAAKLGIIQGKTATTFSPKDTITRAEMSTMIARALKVTNKLNDVADPDAIVKKFTDAGDIISSLKAGVAFAADKGLVFGNAGKFSPNANATRAEAAVILYRTFNYSE
jgi:hypothetical protein